MVVASRRRLAQCCLHPWVHEWPIWCIFHHLLKEVKDIVHTGISFYFVYVLEEDVSCLIPITSLQASGCFKCQDRAPMGNSLGILREGWLPWGCSVCCFFLLIMWTTYTSPFPLPCLISCFFFAFFIYVYSFTTSGKPKILLKISSEWIKATLLWLSSGTNHTWACFATARLLLDHRTALFNLGCPHLAMLKSVF